MHLGWAIIVEVIVCVEATDSLNLSSDQNIKIVCQQMSRDTVIIAKSGTI